MEPPELAARALARSFEVHRYHSSAGNFGVNEARDAEQPCAMAKTGPLSPKLCTEFRMFYVIQVAGISLLAAAFSASALDWHSVDGGRYAELAVSPSGKPGFSLTANPDTGVLFTNSLAEDRHRARSGA